MDEFAGHIENYQDLIAAIISELARGDVTVEAARWIAATELELFRDCDVQPGDQKVSSTIPAAANTITLPVGTIEIRHMQLDLSPAVQLTIASLDRIMQLRENDKSGIPRKYYRFGDQLELGPTNKDTATTAYTLWYYGLPSPLSESNPTNELFRLGWDAYLYGALTHSAAYFGFDDPARSAEWRSLYSAKKESLRRAYWNARMSGSLQQAPDNWLSDGHSEN